MVGECARLPCQSISFDLRKLGGIQEGTAPSTLLYAANGALSSSSRRSGQRAGVQKAARIAGILSVSAGQLRYPTYEATDCPNVDGGRPGIFEGNLRSAEDRWLTKIGLRWLVGRSCCDDVSVRVIGKGDVFTFAVVHQTHREILKRSTKFVIRKRFRA
jgi:hypothetical protein